jgi:hypothetical protein
MSITYNPPMHILIPIWRKTLFKTTKFHIAHPMHLAIHNYHIFHILVGIDVTML